MAELTSQRIQIGIHDIGLSIVNDITREEMLYISLNKSKVIWTEQKKTRVKPLSHDANEQLEEVYFSYLAEREANPDDRQLLRKAYRANEYPVGTFSRHSEGVSTGPCRKSSSTVILRHWSLRKGRGKTSSDNLSKVCGSIILGRTRRRR